MIEESGEGSGEDIYKEARARHPSSSGNQSAEKSSGAGSSFDDLLKDNPDIADFLAHANSELSTNDRKPHIRTTSRPLSELSAAEIEEGIAKAEDWANHSKDPTSIPEIDNIQDSIDLQDQKALDREIRQAVAETAELKAELTRKANEQLRSLKTPENRIKNKKKKKTKLIEEKKHSRELKVVRKPEKFIAERPPEPSEVPPPVSVTLEKALVDVLTKYGTTPSEIRENIKNAEVTEAYKVVEFIMNAQILDIKLRDDEFQKDPETQQLVAEMEAAYKALVVEPDNTHIRKGPKTGKPTVDITPHVTKDGEVSATIRREPGEVNYSFNLTRTKNTRMFTSMFKLEIATIMDAGKAAKSQADGNPLKVNPDYGTADADPQVELLNKYFMRMFDRLDANEQALQDPDGLLQKELGLTDEQVTKLLQQNDLILALFEEIYDKELSWN